MKNRGQQLARLLALLALVVAAFVGLGFRLVDLQVWRHDELSRLAEKSSVAKIPQAARRGDILDANGNLLATSVPVKTVCANPSLIGNQQAAVAHALAPLLQMNESDLFRKLVRQTNYSKGQTVTNQHAVLQRKVSDETWQKISSAMTNLPLAVDESKMSKTERVNFRNFALNLRQYAIFGEDDQLRVYQNGRLAAHVLGFVGTRQDTNNVSELFGYDGIENFFNDNLEGASGWRVTGMDSRKNELAQLRDEDVQARDGLSVVLTIDTAVQNILETELADAMREHAPDGITGIIMRPSTGEILAMASLPNFDPNDVRAADTNALRNRVISDVMEPGSTFKTIVIAGALNEHLVTLNDTFFCENGFFQYGGIPLRDSEGHHFGNLPVWQILQKSSNIGAAKIGIKLQAPKLYDYMENFGLGAATGIPLPGEISARRFVRPANEWGKYSIAQIPMGQGVSVTRLQMAMAVGAIANGGVLMRPMLVKQLQDGNGNIVQKYEPQAVRRVVSEDTAKQMVEALKTVVSKDGTAPLASLANYVVAGKTGTAEKTVEGHVGYVEGKYVVSFIGFFPADNPQICISIVMDSPKEGGRAFGGALCGPVFHNVAERCASYLNIPADENLQNPPRQIIATAQNNFQNP
jgi:cell division protein FtsI/penicillin-binding protein 2